MKNIILTSKIPATNENEDLTYISNALDHARKAKIFDLASQFELSIFHLQKACKIIDQLFVTRKDKYQDYQILLAPFYYKIGDAIATYVELNMNEMNVLKPLELPEDPDDKEEDAYDQEHEESPEKLDINKKDDDEPQITDFIDSSTKNKHQTQQPADGEPTEFE